MSLRNIAWIAILLPAILVAPLPGANSGVKLHAELDSPEIAVGDDVVYTLSVEGENIPENLQPNIPGIRADGIEFRGVSTSRSMTSGSSIHIEINGRVVRDENSGTQTVNFEYHLRGEKPGSYQIGPAEVNIGGINYTGNAVTLKVTSLPPAGKNVIPTGKVFIQAEPSTQKLWLGQPFTVSYYFYAREDSNVEQLANTELPELNGFLKHDFERVQSKPNTEVLNGVRYIRVYLGRLILFPTRAGKLSIEPLHQYYTVLTQSGFFAQRGSAKAASQPVSVDVMALPESGKPADFSGAVGRFSVEASIDRANVRAGENVTMTVKIIGTGNLAGASDPTIILPPAVESYPPEKEDKSSMEGNNLKWERTYRYILTPPAGQVTIGPARFSFFDPEGGYKTANSASFVLNSAPGAETASATGEISGTSQKLGSDIRYIQLDTNKLREQDPFLYKRGWFIAIQFLPPILLGATLLWRRRRDRLETDIPFARRLKSYRKALERIEKARKTITTSSDDFHRELYMAISGFMADYFNLPDIGLPPGEFVPHLQTAAFSEENMDRVIKFLENCLAVRYLPGSCNEKEKDLPVEATDIIKLLRRTLKEAPIP